LLTEVLALLPPASPDVRLGDRACGSRTRLRRRAGDHCSVSPLPAPSGASGPSSGPHVGTVPPSAYPSTAGATQQPAAADVEGPSREHLHLGDGGPCRGPGRACSP